MSEKTYLVQEQLGTCCKCGEVRDLREGYCKPCAPPEVVERVRQRIAASDRVVYLEPGVELAGAGELVAVVLSPGGKQPS